MRMILIITIGIVISYLVTKFFVPILIPHTLEIANSGMLELVALILWVMISYLYVKQKDKFRVDGK